MSVSEVAQVLKLTPKQVAAIESEEFDLLPGNTFARGFVRNYARFLQIDAAPLLAALEQRLVRDEVELNPPSNAGGTMPAASGVRIPRALLVSLALVVAVLAVGLYVERFRPEGLSKLRSTAPPASKDAQASAPRDVQASEKVDLPASSPVLAGAAPAPPIQAPAVASAPQPLPTSVAAQAATERGPRRLEFSFDKESWVDVKDADGKTIVSKLNKPGSVLTVEGRPPFDLVVGNAASVHLKFDDRPVDLQPYVGLSVARFRLE